MTECSHCGDEFGYDLTEREFPEGARYLTFTCNPRDNPDYVVEENYLFCSLDCASSHERVQEIFDRDGYSAPDEVREVDDDQVELHAFENAGEKA